MGNPVEILKKYWGYDTFRPLQQEIINSVLAGNDTLALMPTGGGKSICFQVPALANEGLVPCNKPIDRFNERPGAKPEKKRNSRAFYLFRNEFY